MAFRAGLRVPNGIISYPRGAILYTFHFSGASVFVSFFLPFLCVVVTILFAAYFDRVIAQVTSITIMDANAMARMTFFRQQYDDGIITKQQLQNYIAQIMMSDSGW